LKKVTETTKMPYGIGILVMVLFPSLKQSKLWDRYGKKNDRDNFCGINFMLINMLKNSIQRL
jgi:hypothetical protein